ncbi:hypothetical protein AB4Y88_05360 [Paenarthrobacter sp. RAF9]
MSRLVCGEGQVRQLGIRHVMMAVVAMGFGPGAGVEEAEGVAGRDEHVPAVAGRVEAVEACHFRTSHPLKGGGIENLNAGVVGIDETRRRRAGLFRRGIRSG